MAQIGNNNEPLHERALYAHDGTSWQKVKCYASGNLVVDNVPRVPAGATELTARSSATLDNNNFKELLSASTASSFAALSGRTVAAGKRLVIAFVNAITAATTGTLEIQIGKDGVPMPMIVGVAPFNNFAPSIVFTMDGNGTAVHKIAVKNKTGGSTFTAIFAICWEEDIP